MSECDNKFDPKKYQADKIYEFLKFEIDLQSKRVWFFGALISALLTGWYSCGKESENLKLALPFLAFVVSLIQSFLNRGSKYWLNYWHEELKQIKNDGLNIFKNLEPIKDEHLKGTGFFCIKRKVKIPMLFIFFADFVCVNCLGLFIYEAWNNFKFDISFKNFNLPLFVFLIINGIIVILAFTCYNKWKIFESKK